MCHQQHLQFSTVCLLQPLYGCPHLAKSYRASQQSIWRISPDPESKNKASLTRGSDADWCVEPCPSSLRVCARGWLWHWREPSSCSRSGSVLHFLTCQLGQAKHGAFWHQRFYITRSRWQLQSEVALTWCHSKYWSPNPAVDFCMLCLCVQSESGPLQKSDENSIKSTELVCMEMTSNSVISLGCCRRGFSLVSPCIQEVLRMSIKLCFLSCNMCRSLGVCPSGLYSLCGQREESTFGLVRFLWRVPTGVRDIRPSLSLDQWCRICFLRECWKNQGHPLSLILFIAFTDLILTHLPAQPKPECVFPTSEPWVCIPAQSGVILVHLNPGRVPCRYSRKTLWSEFCRTDDLLDQPSFCRRVLNNDLF